MKFVGCVAHLTLANPGAPTLRLRTRDTHDKDAILLVLSGV